MAVASMVINADGTAVDASEEALELLGVTLDELRELPASAFVAGPRDLDAEAAFRTEWERRGSSALFGETSLKRLDGRLVRVRFAIMPTGDGRFRAVLERAADTADRSSAVFVGGEMIAAWREAERRLVDLVRGSPEWRAVNAEIEMIRARYQELFADEASKADR